MSDGGGLRPLRDAGVIALKIFTTATPPTRDGEFAGLAWPDADAQMTVLRLAAKAGLTVFVHAENEEMVAAATARAAALDKGDARTHGLARPPEAEAASVASLLAMNMVAGARLHIAHVTSALTVEVLRRFRGTRTSPPKPARITSPSRRRTWPARASAPASTRPSGTRPTARHCGGALGWHPRHVTTDHAAFAPEEKAAKEGDFLTAPPAIRGSRLWLPTLLDARRRRQDAHGTGVCAISANAAHGSAFRPRAGLRPGRMRT